MARRAESSAAGRLECGGPKTDPPRPASGVRATEGASRDPDGQGATLGLNTAIPWVVEIVGGVGRVEADLRSIDVTKFELMGGTETFQLELGTPRGEGVVRLTGGARTIRIERPSTVPVRLSLNGGTGEVVLDGTRLGGKGGTTKIESPGWERAKDRYKVEIVGGSKSIEIVAGPG
jgi:hypothetical protein